MPGLAGKGTRPKKKKTTKQKGRNTSFTPEDRLGPPPRPLLDHDQPNKNNARMKRD